MSTGYTAGTPLEWETLDLANLIPKEINDIIEKFDIFVEFLSNTIDTLTAALKIAQAFLLNLDDVFGEVYRILIDLINTLIQQLTQTGVYNLIHYTPSFTLYKTPRQWLSEVGNSLHDRMDGRRPILVDEDAYVSAVAIVVTSDNLKDLMMSWRQFCSLLGSFVGSLFGQMGNWPNPGDPFRVIPGVGQVPNWRSIKLGDAIPGLSQVGDYLMGLIDSLRPAQNQSALFADFIAILDNKVKTIERYGKKVLGVLAMMEAILSIEGLYILNIFGQGEATWVQNRLSTANGGPHDYGKYDTEGNLIPEEDRKKATYTLGTVFLATGGTYPGSVEFLVDFFGGKVLPPLNHEIPSLPDVP